MTKKEKIKLAHKILYKKYGDTVCFLKAPNIHQLMVSVILSAQCTDIQVNKVTPKVFEKYKSVYDYANATVAEVAEDIKRIGLNKSKANYIVTSAKEIIERHNGIVPNTMEELTNLTGVGRKTANVILGDGFGLPGFPVDTHVIRIMNRLKVVKTRDATKIEKEVTKHINKKLWSNFSHILILHGREVCDARNPKCETCEFNEFCPKNI